MQNVNPNVPKPEDDICDDPDIINPFMEPEKTLNTNSAPPTETESALNCFAVVEIKRARTDYIEEMKDSLNPFIEENEAKPLNPEDFVDVGALPIISNPPCVTDRKKYTGSPDFALSKLRRPIKRIPNKILGIGENPLLRGKLKGKQEEKVEECGDIPNEGVKGDVTEMGVLE